MTNLEQFKKEVKRLTKEICKKSAKEYAKITIDCPEVKLEELINNFNYNLWNNCEIKKDKHGDCIYKDCEKCLWHWLNSEVKE